QRRQRGANACGRVELDETYTFLRQHDADRVDPERARGERILDAAHAAELDPGAQVHGNVTSSGSPHSRGYSGPRNVSPCAGAVAPASARSRPCSSSAIQAAGRSPRPTGSRLPTMLRTIWCRKALAWIATMTLSSTRVTVSACTSRIGERAWQATVRNA